MFREIPAIALAMLLAGCAANYPLEAANPQRTTVRVKGTAEMVHRQLLLTVTDKCYKLTAEAQYYPAAQVGDILLVKRHNDGNIRMTFVRFETKAVGSSDVDVTVTSRDRMDDLRDASIVWAKGQAGPCPWPFGDG